MVETSECVDVYIRSLISRGSINDNSTFSNMISNYDGNCTSYWSYSPYSYCHSTYDTSSSTSSSSFFESPNSASSPRVMMPCYYYCEPSPPLVPVEIPRPTSNLPNRLQYTVRQRWLLNEIYRYVPYPNSVQKNVIADRVGASREQIRKFLPVAQQLD